MQGPETNQLQVVINILIIGACILLRVYPVMLINHRTQQCFLVLLFIVQFV
jgi:hypothetical protein